MKSSLADLQPGADEGRVPREYCQGVVEGDIFKSDDWKAMALVMESFEQTELSNQEHRESWMQDEAEAIQCAKEACGHVCLNECLQPEPTETSIIKMNARYIYFWFSISV